MFIVSRYDSSGYGAGGDGDDGWFCADTIFVWLHAACRLTNVDDVLGENYVIFFQFTIANASACCIPIRHSLTLNTPISISIIKTFEFKFDSHTHFNQSLVCTYAL